MESFYPGDRVRVFAGYCLSPAAVDYLGCSGKVLEINPEWVNGVSEGLLHVALDTPAPNGILTLVLPVTDFERI